MLTYSVAIAAAEPQVETHHRYKNNSSVSLWDFHSLNIQIKAIFIKSVWPQTKLELKDNKGMFFFL